LKIDKKKLKHRLKKTKFLDWNQWIYHF